MRQRTKVKVAALKQQIADKEAELAAASAEHSRLLDLLRKAPHDGEYWRKEQIMLCARFSILRIERRLEWLHHDLQRRERMLSYIHANQAKNKNVCI